MSALTRKTGAYRGSYVAFRYGRPQVVTLPIVSIQAGARS